MSYYTGTFLGGAHWFGVSFPKLQTFCEIFWGLHVDYSLYVKTMLTRIFCLISCKVIMTKLNFVFANSVVKSQNIVFANQPFLRKMLVLVFTINITLYIEKNLVEKLCKVLEMELCPKFSVSPKFVFEKSTFKVLHYIQRDFIHQQPGFSKDQTSMFKSLVINFISSSNIVTHSNGYIWSNNYFFIRVDAANVFLKFISL